MQFIALLEVDERDSWFQQDRATCHTTQTSMAFLGMLFGDWLISQWLQSPRSPDLHLPDLFLWVHLKGHVYDNNPYSMEELEMNIRCSFTHQSQHSLLSSTQHGETSGYLYLGEG
jgi:hypothetical protein